MSVPVKSVPVQLDRMRALRFDFNALCLLEDSLGVTIFDIGKKLSGKVRLKDLRTIIHAGLIHEDAQLTPEDVGRMLSLTDMGDVARAVREAFEAAFSGAAQARANEKKDAGQGPANG